MIHIGLNNIWHIRGNDNQIKMYFFTECTAYYYKRKYDNIVLIDYDAIC